MFVPTFRGFKQNCFPQSPSYFLKEFRTRLSSPLCDAWKHFVLFCVMFPECRAVFSVLKATWKIEMPNRPFLFMFTFMLKELKRGSWKWIVSFHRKRERERDWKLERISLSKLFIIKLKKETFSLQSVVYTGEDLCYLWTGYIKVRRIRYKNTL